jgi:serine/threonine protein kinase
MAEFTQQQAHELIDRLFVSARSARYQSLEFGNVVETVIPDTLFRFGMNHDFRGEITLQLYRGLRDLGGRLWEQEVHALLRLSASPHPAIPTIIEGDFDDPSNCGFVSSDTTMTRMSQEVLQFIWSHPNIAFRWFGLLVDAVRQLHSHGLMHRNIWPGALEPMSDEDHKDWTGVRLSTFEMSSLVSNLLRLAVRSNPETMQRVSEYYKRGGSSCLVCCPRERLSLVFPEAKLGGHDDFRSDVFSLGIIGFQWFFGMHVDDSELNALGDAEDWSGILKWHESIRRRLRGGRMDGPRELADLLRNMLESEAAKRFTASEVVDAIGRHYENITSFWRPQGTNKPLLLAIASKRAGEAFVELGWLTGDATTEAGFVTLREVLEADLRGAELVYSPTGAISYLHSGVKAEMALCYWVIIGLQWIYFCQEYQPPGSTSQARTPIPWALHLRYAVDRSESNLERLTATPFRRRLPRIKIVPGRSSDLQPAAENKKHPYWTPYLEDVRNNVRPVAWHHGFKQGIDWLLRYQRTRLEARQYPFIRKELSPDGRAVLVLDQERDDAWREKRPLLYLFSGDPRRRAAFGDFFDTLADRDLGKRVSWQPDFKGSPTRSAERNLEGGVVVRRLNAHEIEVRPLARAEHIPGKGWLRPFDDWASEVLWQRQGNARTDLFENSALLEGLYQPRGIRGPRAPWLDAAGNLRGPAAELIPEILATRPFFALQGPPGSGKTDVVTAVVRAVLARDSAGRLLVSSQSHFALDELAERIIGALLPRKKPNQQKRASGTDFIMIRVGSAEAESNSNIKPALRAFLPENLAASRVALVKLRCSKILSRRDLDGRLRSIVKSWQKAVDASVLEIRDRLWRGANVVFATCGAATERNLGVHGAFNRFDWVIVEEAAKAWLSEVAMPLVHGNRWLLVGDHKQLGPYQQREILELLSACQRSQRPDLKELVDPSREFLATFQYFANLFGEATFPADLVADAEPPPMTVARIASAPVRTLGLQFRMHRTIAEVIRTCFYKGKLATDDSANIIHDIETPAFLAKQPLVWLDTSRLPHCQAEERQWKNRGEAEVVAKLLQLLAPDPLRNTKGREDRIAVLTPYWDHHAYLSQVVPQQFRRYIYIADSFQGRQADIVIISLVRVNFQPEDDPLSRLGYLAAEERINVMLSRARQLLICVGNFEHFARSFDTPWPDICRVVQKTGTTIAPDAGSEFGSAKS